MFRNSPYRGTSNASDLEVVLLDRDVLGLPKLILLIADGLYKEVNNPTRITILVVKWSNIRVCQSNSTSYPSQLRQARDLRPPCFG